MKILLILLSLALSYKKLRVHILPHSHDDVGWMAPYD